MITEVKLAEIIIEDIKRINSKFIYEAQGVWDMKAGYCGFYDIFLSVYLGRKWQEMVRDN